jgi:hypothetical protein
MREPGDRCILTERQCVPDSDMQKKCGLYKHTKEAVSAAKAIVKGKAAKAAKSDSWDTAKGDNGSKPPVKTPKKKAAVVATTDKSKPRNPKIKK